MLSKLLKCQTDGECDPINSNELLGPEIFT